MAPEDLGSKGEFRLLSKIGEGGMADVFLAERLGDDGFKTRVALKRLHQGLAMDSYFIRQLVREARLLGQLEHANIVRVFDLRRIGDEYFVVMEYVDGIDLAAVIKVHRQRQTRVPLPFFFHVALSLLEALGYAHAAVDLDANPTPLIHRDIKPSNVMLSRRGVVKLTDFGIAHVGDGSVTGGLVQGTANYMSPEQAYGEEHLSPASDIYSLGVVFFEMLCGRPLVDGDNYLRAIQQVREQVVTSEELEALGVKPGLRMVVARMLSRDRAVRYAESDMVRNDLQFVADRLGINLSWHRIRAYVGRLMGILGRAPSRATLSNLKVQEDASDPGFSSGSYGAESTLPPPFGATGPTTPVTPQPVTLSPTSAADVTSAVRKDLLDEQLSNQGQSPVSVEEASPTESAAKGVEGEGDTDAGPDSTAIVDHAEQQDDDEEPDDDGGTTAGDSASPIDIEEQAANATADWIEDDETAVYTGELPGMGGSGEEGADGFGSFEENTDERTVPYVGQGPRTGAGGAPGAPDRISPPPRPTGSFPPPPLSLTGEFRQQSKPPTPSPAAPFLPDGSEDEGPTGTQVLGEAAESADEKTWVLTADVQQIAAERSTPQTGASSQVQGATAAAAADPRGRPGPEQGVRRRRKRRRKRKSQTMFLGLERRTVMMAAIFSLVIGALLFFILAVLFVRSQQGAQAPAPEPDLMLVDSWIDEPLEPVQFLTGSCILARDSGGTPVWPPGPGIVAASSQQGDIET